MIHFSEKTWQLPDTGIALRFPVTNILTYLLGQNETLPWDLSTPTTTTTYAYDSTCSTCSNTTTSADSKVYYYGYRCYSPEFGRWLSRDPIGELAAVNLYGFVQNPAINLVDVLGLEEVTFDALGQGDFAVVSYDVVRDTCENGGGVSIENVDFVEGKDPDSISLDIIDIFDLWPGAGPWGFGVFSIFDRSYGVTSKEDQDAIEWEDCEEEGERRLVKEIDIIITTTVNLATVLGSPGRTWQFESRENVTVKGDCCPCPPEEEGSNE